MAPPAVVAGHSHPWPDTASGWDRISTCVSCGARTLRLFRHSASWVVRRVENVKFIDDRTVRRRVSIDYEAPPDAVVFDLAGGGQVRVLPLAILRRKSLINFDFVDDEGKVQPLLGLRENQSLTLGVARAWATAANSDGGRLDPLPSEVDEFLDDVVAGDQSELRGAYLRMWAAGRESPLRQLGIDPSFRVVIDRLADSFILYYLHYGPVGERRVVTLSYDEPFTLRYYRPINARVPSDGADSAACVPKQEYDNQKLSRWSIAALSAAVGLSATRIEFPVPAAELAASFHFEISAPPEVTIVGAAALAGRPNVGPGDRANGSDADRGTMKSRLRHRPSFDAVGGGYPTVDLHLAEVPYGSRSLARVEVEARVGGWFASAVLSSWVATVVLLLAWRLEPTFDVGSSLLMSFTAGLIAILVRPDPHRLMTRLLSSVRLLIAVVALLSFAAASLVAFADQRAAHGWLLRLFLATTLPTGLITLAWLSAAVRWIRRDQRESPWEHHRPRRSRIQSLTPTRHEALATAMDSCDHPYEHAFRELGFDRPAIQVASCEGVRTRLVWTAAFAAAFERRLDWLRTATSR
jgi:hypothetical protein